MNKSISIAILTLLMFVSSTHLQAQMQWGEMQNISNEYGPSDEHDIANIGDHYFMVWNQWGDLMFRKSENGGQNWGEKLTLYSAFDYGASYPVIAATGQNVYVAYYRNTSGNSEIFMVKSTNGGQNFGNEMQITNSIRLAQVPQIVASGDTVIVAYEDRDADYDYQIYLTYSLDGGTSWTDAQKITNTTGNARWCNLAMDSEKLVVSWNEQTGSSYNDLDLFVSTSTNFGQSWTNPENVSNNMAYNARLNTEILGSSIYVVVSAKVDGLQSDIMLYRSDDFGGNWQAPVNLSDNSGASSRPDIWLASNYAGSHRIYVVWSDETYTSNERAYLKYSIDNGFTWSGLIEFSNATEDAAWVQIVGQATGSVDELYTAWYRPDDGTFNYEIWGRAAQNQITTDVNLSGIISDADQNLIENATVALGGYLTFSLGDGSYSLDVPSGTYPFSVSAAGFQNFSLPALELSEDMVLNVSLDALVPGNYPPHNLKLEQQGVNSIFATWESPIGFASQELFYDDGEANGLYWPGTATGNEFMAVAFEHEEACYLRQVKLFTSPGITGEQMKVWILGAENGSPSLTTVFGGPYLIDINSPWTVVNIDIPIPANVRFYAACQWENENLYKVGGDLNQPDGFSYSTSDGGETWYVHDDMDFMIRAGIAFDDRKDQKLHTNIKNTKELLGYNVYLDGILWLEMINQNYISINELAPGHNYTLDIKAVYDDGLSPASTASIFIPEPLLFPPLNLAAEEQTVPDLAIKLTWDAPASQGQWIHWDDGQNSDAVGGENIEIFDAAIRFTTDDLDTLDGQYLTQVSFFVADANCQFFIRVWQGGNQNYAGTLIREQAVAYPIANEWNIYDLESPVMIDASQELWFGYRAINTQGVYPAGTDNGPAVPFKGDMILYGDDWVSMSSYFGWDINWNIQGLVVDAGEAPASKWGSGDFYNQNPENIGIPKKISNSKSSKPFLWEYSHFNIYNQNQLLGTSSAGIYEFLDTEVQMYNVYTVSTAWDSFESSPSNEVIVSYVGMDDLPNLQNSFELWPNPANDKIHIRVNTDREEQVSIWLCDINGKMITTLFEGMTQKGTSTFVSDLTDKAIESGVYFIKIQQGENVRLKKLVYLN